MSMNRVMQNAITEETIKVDEIRHEGLSMSFTSRVYAGSCTNCGDTKSKNVYEISVRNLHFRLCKHCLRILGALIKGSHV